MKKASRSTTKLTPVDFRRFNLKTLFCGEYRYLLLLIYWALYGAAFSAIEVFRTYPEVYHYSVSSPLDNVIPFCEFFVIPYFFWFVYLVGMYVYSIFFDTETFKNYTYFIMITYTTTLIIYLIWPTMQELRPVEFTRDNLFTDIMKNFYGFDTNTNVCPSIHVIGAVAVSCAAWNSKLFSSWGWRIAFSVATVLIVLSTVFLKQHSVLDIPPALLLCAIAYPLVYGKRFRAFLARKRKEHKEKRRNS